jgi:DNA-binding transcriptional ArsR family regulator
VTVDATWRALADPTRRRLIELLRDGPKTTGELCRAFSTSRFAVMKHLGVLERSGLLTVRRAGRRRWNTLNKDNLHDIGGRWSSESLPTAEPATRAGSAAAGTVPEAVGIATTPPFTHLQVFVDAVPWKVFDALTVNVAAWWGPPHLVAADASNLVLEPQPGGRFYEEWGHRQGALRGVVAAIRRDERLDLAGAICDDGADGKLSFVLEPREGGTLLVVSATGLPADAVEDLIRIRLKAFVEHGTRSGITR